MKRMVKWMMVNNLESCGYWKPPPVRRVGLLRASPRLESRGYWEPPPVWRVGVTESLPRLESGDYWASPCLIRNAWFEVLKATKTREIFNRKDRGIKKIKETLEKFAICRRTKTFLISGQWTLHPAVQTVLFQLDRSLEARYGSMLRNP